MIEDLSLALISGVDIPIPEAQITLHQPTIKEIAYIGEKDFFTGVQCLNIKKSMFAQGENVLGDINNFQIFMTLMSQNEAKAQKEAVQKLLMICFPKSQVLFTPRSLIFQNGDQSSLVDENNFEFIQQVVSQVFCTQSTRMDQTNFNPANEQARKIAEKLMRGRQRVAAQNGANSGSIFSQYLSILTVGLGSMSMEDLLDLTMYQLFDLVERYQLYISWDLDVRTRLAGGKPDKEIDNWMKNIH